MTLDFLEAFKHLRSQNVDSPKKMRFSDDFILSDSIRKDFQMIKDIRTDSFVKADLCLTIKSITSKEITFKDPSGEIQGTISKHVLVKPKVGQIYQIKNATVFRLSEFSDLHVNITQENIFNLIESEMSQSF